MEGTFGSYTDKTRVLDIRPLRSLKPVFPSGNQAPPFVCAPPYGPFPPGFSPFYPFSSSQANQQTSDLCQAQNHPQYQPQIPSQHQPQIPSQHQAQSQHQPQIPPQHQHQSQPQQQPQAPQQFQHQGLPQNLSEPAVSIPLRSFGSPDTSNGITEPKVSPLKRTTPKRRRPENVNFESGISLADRENGNRDLNQPQNPLEPSLVTPLRSFRSPDTSNGDIEPEGSTLKRKIPKKRRPENVNFDSGISVAEREIGNRELVVSVLMRFDALRRRLAQLEDAREAVSGINKRADLKSGSICMSSGVRTNSKKGPGVIPGVEIGDIFFFRFEMCLVGLHSQSMAGIDYLVVKGETEEERIATSIVSSGYYDNDEGNPDVLVYTGQGGNADKDKQTSDQKLERGNVALENSLRRNSAVRVIRGLNFKDAAKIYVYDGLYEIKESWVEKGKSGHNTFKYKLVRAPGQLPAFAVLTAIQKWKEGLPSRQGLILPDLTSGVESIPVSLLNDVDDENGPAYFTYSTTVTYSESFKLAQPSFGCDCGISCKPGNLNCHCIRKNGGDFPYTGNGVLVSRKPMIYECSPSCLCSACKNKVTQMGPKVRLEVFKTTNRGWGLRSWDPIRAGSFICIYAGEAEDKSKVQQTVADDDYTFDTTRIYTPFNWNYEAGLADEDASEKMSEEPEMTLPLIINAKKFGNVARFMNHSCSPNVLWQPVTYENNSQLLLQVAFFAISHIPPMTELTYDYGVSQPSEAENANPLHGKKTCFCGSEYCRGSFG
ncbi:unnamed protein product [Cochlearia groenlandica]